MKQSVCPHRTCSFNDVTAPGAPPTRAGFTLIEVLVVIAIVTVLIGILLPALGNARRSAWQTTATTQLRGIQQGLYSFAQGNKAPGSDGFYPGFNKRGMITATVSASSPYPSGGELGDAPVTRLAILLNRGYFAPEYCINPIELGGVKTPAEASAAMTTANYSWAMLRIDNGATQTNAGRNAEWRETTNSSAPIMADRLTAGDPTVQSGHAGGAESAWTATGSSDWQGAVVMNDGSSTFLSLRGDDVLSAGGDSQLVPIVKDTRFGGAAFVPADNLFVDEASDAGYNALLVYSDANSIN